MGNNCWTCGYQRNTGPKTFLGFCDYFTTVGRPTKEIPPDIVDAGCSYWKPYSGKPEVNPESGE
jgi:hypothetical protein